MEKTYIFGDGQNSGFDTNLLAAMNNGGFGGGNWFTILFLLVLFGRDGFGRGGYNMDYIGSQLSNAAQGNANAISNLSTQLNCTNGQIQSAIGQVQNAIQQTANANNMTGMQLANAINSGDAGIINQLQSCCCSITNAVNTGFGNLRYESAAQTCAIKQNDTDNTNRILAKIDAVQDEAKNNKINELTAQLTAATSRAERAAELAPIYQALNDIKCKQPASVTIPYSPVVGVPSCVAWNAGLAGLYGAGYSQGGSIWP